MSTASLAGKKVQHPRSSTDTLSGFEAFGALSDASLKIKTRSFLNAIEQMYRFFAIQTTSFGKLASLEEFKNEVGKSVDAFHQMFGDGLVSVFRLYPSLFLYHVMNDDHVAGDGVPTIPSALKEVVKSLLENVSHVSSFTVIRKRSKLSFELAGFSLVSDLLDECKSYGHGAIAQGLLQYQEKLKLGKLRYVLKPGEKNNFVHFVLMPLFLASFSTPEASLPPFFGEEDLDVSLVGKTFNQLLPESLAACDKIYASMAEKEGK